jgi:hypothetical protein
LGKFYCTVAVNHGMRNILFLPEVEEKKKGFGKGIMQSAGRGSVL